MVIVKFHSCYLAGALRETDSEEGSSSEFTLDGFALDLISAHGNSEPSQVPENLDDVDAPLYQLGMLPSKIQQKKSLQVKLKKKKTAKERNIRENLRAPVSSTMRNNWIASRPGKPRKPNKRPALRRGEDLNNFKLSWKEEDDEGGWDEYHGPSEDNWTFSKDYNPPKPSKTLRDFFDGTSLLDSIQGEGTMKAGVLQSGGINPWNVETMPWPTEHIFNQPKVPMSPIVPLAFKDPAPQPLLYSSAAIDDKARATRKRHLTLYNDFEFDHDIELEMALWLSLDDNNPPVERPKPIEPAVPPPKKIEPPPPQEHPFKESPVLTAADFRDSSPSSSLNLCGASDLARDEYVVQASPAVKGTPVSPRVKLTPAPGHLQQSPNAFPHNENYGDAVTYVHEECGKSVEPVATRHSQSKVKSTQSQTPPPSAFLSMHQEQTPPEGEHARPLVSGKMEEPSPKPTAKKKKRKKKKRIRRKKRQQEAAARKAELEKFDLNARRRGYNVQAKISPLVTRRKETQILDHETRRDISFRRSKKPSASHFDWQKKPPKSPEKKAVTWNTDGILNQGSPVSSTSLASGHRKPPSPLTHPLAIKSNIQSQSLRAKQHPLALTHIRDMNQKSPLDPNAEQFFPPPNYSLPPKLHNGRAKEVNSSRRCGEDVIRELRLVLGSNGRPSSSAVNEIEGSGDEASMVEKVVEEELQTTYMSSCSEWSEENLTTEEEIVHTEDILRPPVAKPNPIEALRSTPGKNPTQRLQINSTPGNRTQKPWERVLGSTPGGGGEPKPKPAAEKHPEWDNQEGSESYYSESEQEPVPAPQPMKALIPKYEEPVMTGATSPPRQHPYRAAVQVSSNLPKWAHPRTPSYKLAPKRFPFPRPLDKVKEPNRGPKPDGRSDHGLKSGKRSSKPGKRLTKKYKLERQTKDNMSARRSGKDYEAAARHSLDVDSSARKSSNRSCGLVFGPHSRDGSDLPSIRSKKRRKSRSRRNRKSPNRFAKASSKQADLARTPKPKPVPAPTKSSKSLMARGRDKPKLCPMKPVAAKNATRSSRKKKKVLFQELSNKNSSMNPAPWANKNRDRMQAKQRDTEKSYLYYSTEGEKTSEVLPTRQSPIKQALSRSQVSSRRKKTAKKRKSSLGKARWGSDGLNFTTPDFSEDQVKEAIRLSLLPNPNDNSGVTNREERVQRRLDEKCTTLQYIRPNCIVTIDTFKGSKIRGIVEHVMTTASTDPRGIRVKLKTGEIGRVWRLEKGVDMVDCPICTKAFPQCEIDNHLRHTHFI